MQEVVDLYAALGVSRKATDTEVIGCSIASTAALPGSAPALAHRRSSPRLPASHISIFITCPRLHYLQIRRAYRNLASKAHPDKGGDPELFRSIQQAWEVLSDGDKRKEYDATGRVVKSVEEEFMDR